jgi:uncharacterized protein (TIGR02391 family)
MGIFLPSTAGFINTLSFFVVCIIIMEIYNDINYKKLFLSVLYSIKMEFMKQLKIKDIDDQRILFAIRKLCLIIIELKEHVSAGEEFDYKVSKARSSISDIDELAKISFNKSSVKNPDGTITIKQKKEYSGSLTLELLLLSFYEVYNLIKDSFIDDDLENDFVIYYDFLEKINDEGSLDTQYFWNYIDKDISNKFNWNYFSNKKDTIFNITVFLEEKIRNKVKEESGDELSGVSLMRRAFSLTNPIILVVKDLNSQINKDIQEGTMNLAVSIMQKIKNPKSHSFEYGEEDEIFIGHIFMCDALYKKIKMHL